MAAAIIDAADPALEVARLLGIKRLTGARVSVSSVFCGPEMAL
ncbi:MAG: hypothetical protein ACRYF9_24990 [Janthinobacterium lividum]